MESARTFLWLTCGVLIMFLFIEWNDPGVVQPPERTQESSLMQAPADNVSDDQYSSESFQDDLPSISANNSVITLDTSSNRSETITLSNSVLSISVDTKGADIVAAKLLKYYPSKNEQDKNVDLMYMNDTISDFHRLQSGLLLTNGAKSPTHIENYSLISKGRSKLTFIWESETTRTTKTLTLNPDSYLVNISFSLENMTDEQVSYIPYYQLVKDNVEFERSMFDVESYSFDGGIIFDGDSYEKQYADDLIDEPYKKTHTNGWFANIRHHFVVAVLPAMGTEHRFEAEHDQTANLNKLTAISNSAITAGPKQNTQTSFDIFIGPKLQNELTMARDGLEVSVDYGMLSFLAKPMFWALNKSHSFLGNWGLAIIFVTLMIKAVFYRLQESSSRSMAKMRELAPRLKALNERYKDDRTALGQAQMELYKRESVNPMAGCLPLLIQIPFFIAFYWVLLESVEIRQAPFYFWLDDLSSRDPYFVLPLIMGVVMFFQQKANPAPADPVQEKVFMFMPIIFTLLFAWFPSGLVLYWVTNSLLQFAQQWNVNRKMAAEKN